MRFSLYIFAETINIVNCSQNLQKFICRAAFQDCVLHDGQETLLTSVDYLPTECLRE